MKLGVLSLIVIGVVIGVIVYLLTRKEGLVESIVLPRWEKKYAYNKPRGAGWVKVSGEWKRFPGTRTSPMPLWQRPI